MRAVDKKQIGDFRQKETSDLLRGNAVHHAIETYGERMMNSLPPLDLDELLDIGENYIVENVNKVEVWRHNASEQRSAQGQACMQGGVPQPPNKPQSPLNLN